MANLLSLCLTALFLYFTWRLLKLLHFYFREYYIFWNVAMGGGMSGSKRMKLHMYICKTELLDEVSVNELYTFLRKMIDADITVKDFHHSVLLSYDSVVIARERKDGSLRGMALVGIDRKEINGVKFTLFRNGLNFFQNFYRGGPFLYYAYIYYILKELVLHPFTPLYVVGKAFSYKSYLHLCNAVSCYPRHDSETPDFARQILNDFGESVKVPHETYDRDTFVLKREFSSLKTGIATVRPEDLNNPHIKFFVERNPGWARGHQLLMLGVLSWSDFFSVAWKALMKSKVKKPRKKPLLKRFTFQSEEAARYTTIYSEMDIGGVRNDHQVILEDSDENVPKLLRTVSNLHSYDVYDDLW